MRQIPKALTALVLAVGPPCVANPQEPAETLPNYAPLLLQVQAKVTHVDPQKGYAVKQLKVDIYMVTDGAYESVFVTTGKGVVLFDAPPPPFLNISCKPSTRQPASLSWNSCIRTYTWTTSAGQA
jgi:hypothetical protein